MIAKCAAICTRGIEVHAALAAFTIALPLLEVRKQSMLNHGVVISAFGAPFHRTGQSCAGRRSSVRTEVVQWLQTCRHLL